MLQSPPIMICIQSLWMNSIAADTLTHELAKRGSSTPLLSQKQVPYDFEGHRV
jgi:hypothetical protein